jgi:CRP-like cAMP-binding protein
MRICARGEPERGAAVRAEQAAELLGNTDLFADLDRSALLSLGERALERRYKKGQIIFHQGDLGDTLYVLAEGTVKVFVTSEHGDEMVLATLHPPDTLGELAVIDGGPRSASAETLEPATLLALTRPTLLELLEGSRALTDALLRSIGNMVRRLTEQASDLVFLDLYGRVAKLLLGFADSRGREAEDGIVLDLAMTQTDLAAMVGGSRQSVNQILRRFEKRGIVELRGRTVVIKEPALLRRRAGI